MQDTARTAEALVLFGYRNFMAAYEFSDVSCWEAVWQAYIAELGDSNARRLIGELQYWGRSIRQRAGRDLHYFPASCVRMSDDETTVLAMVSAAQSDDADTGKLAATLLVGAGDREAVHALWQASICLGCSLKESGQVLCPSLAQSLGGIVSSQKTTGARLESQFIS